MNFVDARAWCYRAHVFFPLDYIPLLSHFLGSVCPWLSTRCQWWGMFSRRARCLSVGSQCPPQPPVQGNKSNSASTDKLNIGQFRLCIYKGPVASPEGTNTNTRWLKRYFFAQIIWDAETHNFFFLWIDVTPLLKIPPLSRSLRPNWRKCTI